MMEIQNIRVRVQALAPHIVGLRRNFHRHPELSGQETKTRERILGELRDIGLSCEERDGNVYAVLEGVAPGKTVVLRGDFDALPVQEDTGCEYHSETPGVMHACGHDGHTAMLLGAARVLAGYRQFLCGKVVFLFQYGEEVGRGAMEALTYLKGLERVDAVLGVHVMSDIPTGQIMVCSGAVMAGSTGFQLEVNGSGGHSSSPWAAVDPIRPLCEILMRYTSLTVNKFDVFDSFVICPCVLRAGEVANIIPEKAAFQATLRLFNAALFPAIRKELIEIADCVANSYHAKANLLMGPLMEPVVNDTAIAEKVSGVVSEIEGLTRSDHRPFMLSDNFALILKEYPGAYCFLGIGNGEKQSTYAHHHPKFQIDEDALPQGVEFLARGAIALLAE